MPETEERDAAPTVILLLAPAPMHGNPTYVAELEEAATRG